MPLLCTSLSHKGRAIKSTTYFSCETCGLCASYMRATIAACREALVALLMSFRDDGGCTRDAAQRARRDTPEGTDTWHRKVEGFFWCTSISTPSTTRNSTSGIPRNIC